MNLNPIIDVPQKLLLDLAVGLEPFADICARYDYTPEQTDQLRDNPGIKNRVMRMQAELKDSGITFRMRNAHAAEDMIGVIWSEARRPETSLDKKIEAAKLFAKLGDLEPKQNVQAVSGGGVTININIPSLDSAPPQTITIDQQAFPSTNKNHELMLPEDFDCEFA